MRREAVFALLLLFCLVVWAVVVGALVYLWVLLA